jgi:hypothetical protein
MDREMWDEAAYIPDGGDEDAHLVPALMVGEE